MRSKFLLFSLLLVVIVVGARAARVDTVLVRSGMKKDIEVIYVLPDRAMDRNGGRCPVIYLLHGYGNDARCWITLKPDLPKIADERGIIFVCPDGLDSWYLDSPKDDSYRYERFISSELVEYTDGHYATIADRSGRAISGLSMGGHGALWNAIRHPEVFGAAGSTSGGVDLRPFPSGWNLSKLLGEWKENGKVWDEHTVITQVDRIKKGDLALIIDCGEEDFFLNVNKDLHGRLLECSIDHDFITRPGGHNGAYWTNSIDYQILFFSKFFARKP